MHVEWRGGCDRVGSAQCLIFFRLHIIFLNHVLIFISTKLEVWPGVAIIWERLVFSRREGVDNLTSPLAVTLWLWNLSKCRVDFNSVNLI